MNNKNVQFKDLHVGRSGLDEYLDELETKTTKQDGENFIAWIGGSLRRWIKKI